MNPVGTVLREHGEVPVLMPILSIPIDEPAAPTPCDIVLLLDTSGSMATIMPFVRRSVEWIIRSIAEKGHPSTRLAIVTFSAQATLILPLTEITVPDETVDACMSHLVAHGATNLEHALRLGLLELCDSVRPTTIILLTDGTPTAGETDPLTLQNQMQNMLPESSTPSVYALACGRCNFALLQGLVSASYAGSLFEIKPHTNPAAVLGVMLGLVLFLRALDVRLEVTGPASLLDLRTGREVHDGRLVVEFAHRAVGERCDALVQVQTGYSEGAELRCIWTFEDAQTLTMREVVTVAAVEDDAEAKESGVNLEVTEARLAARAAWLLQQPSTVEAKREAAALMDEVVAMPMSAVGAEIQGALRHAAAPASRERTAASRTTFTRFLRRRPTVDEEGEMMDIPDLMRQFSESAHEFSM